ncbi:SHC-transforming protein 1 [Trichoplax sp. H2]|nr:SHC-transforming protein 1 [Trichoplax sp. H2]|eukprot:RDD40386.1 SHC-transforming protein 1 [Trichoplax sp. H2]
MNGRREHRKKGKAYRWIHPSSVFEDGGGACYTSKYIGCIPIISSIRTCTDELRTEIIRDAISKCAIETKCGPYKDMKKRKMSKQAAKFLGAYAKNSFVGHEVGVAVTVTQVITYDIKLNESIFNHSVKGISYVACGEKEQSQFLAYVAKESADKRCCYVFSCENDVADCLVVTLGQAFELCYKRTTKQARASAQQAVDGEIPNNMSKNKDVNELESQAKYINDDIIRTLTRQPSAPPELQTSVPPELQSVAPVQLRGTAPPDDQNLSVPPKVLRSQSAHIETEVALIDLSDTTGNINDRLKDSHLVATNDPWAEVMASNNPQDVYINTSPPEYYNIVNFDVPSHVANSVGLAKLQRELWYHGGLSRGDAEKLLQKNGQFLVRQSVNNPMQFVLSGMIDNVPHHVLVTNEQGIVKTQDYKFDSVSQLVEFHRKSDKPLVSQTDHLWLKFPIPRQC